MVTSSQKQDKVLKLINRECGKKTPLGTVPNDECYTSMQDIILHLTPLFLEIAWVKILVEAKFTPEHATVVAKLKTEKLSE